MSSKDIEQLDWENIELNCILTKINKASVPKGDDDETTYYATDKAMG